MKGPGLLARLVASLAEGSVRLVDLTHPLSDETPVIQLPEPFDPVPRFRLRELSRYDERGPWSYKNAFETWEHVGTHFDAPVHWITGRDGENVADVPASRLIGPAVVIDQRRETEEDPGYLLTEEDVRGFERDHGALPRDGWLLLRTGWAARYRSEAAFLNGSVWPGATAECARYLAESTELLGVGTETVGIDAGSAHSFDPPFPMHHYLLGAGKYGLASLANLEQLPAMGAVLLAAPLRIAGGSGSSMRAFALVPGESPS